MVEAGVDLIELQIPFYDPIAGGPLILRANQRAIEKKESVRAILDFAQEVTRVCNIPFLFMTYYNILVKYGVPRFISATVKGNIGMGVGPR